MSETADAREKITIVARSGRWRMTFRADPAVTPPTWDEAQALAEEIVVALLGAYGVPLPEMIDETEDDAPESTAV